MPRTDAADFIVEYKLEVQLGQCIPSTTDMDRECPTWWNYWSP